MAPAKTVEPTAIASSSPFQLDTDQTLKATKALVRKLQSDQKSQLATGEKANLLADADAEEASDDAPVWLILTTKKHIVDKKRLKPGKIALPHPYLKLDGPTETALRICLITADPQRRYKDLIADPSFPLDISKNIQRVIGLEKLKAKYNSFESKRQLLGEYDVFLADDRIITYLPTVLGKTFYKTSAKRPVPISLEGRRQNFDEHGKKRQKLAEGGTKVVKSEPKPTDVAIEVKKSLSSALVHLAPSTTTAVKIGNASMKPKQIQKNIEAVVSGLVETYVPQKWRNIRAIHVKGANTAALPIWLTEELWTDAQDVLDEPLPLPGKSQKKRKRDALTAGDASGNAPAIIEVPGPDGKMRRLEKPAEKAVKARTDNKRKNNTLETEESELEKAEKAEKAARREGLKKQKAALRGEGGESLTDVPASNTKPAKRVRTKAADLI